MLEIRGLTSGYGRKTVLSRVSLTANDGELTVIIGKNGCGKTTLLRSVIASVKPSSGEILADGCSLADMTATERAKRIAYLSQGRHMPDMTVYELVLHGRFAHLSYPRRYSENDRSLALSAMEKTDIRHLSDEPLASLSGGLRQRAYIAMALCQDARHILLDEPTTYLDIGGQLELMKTVRTLADEGRSVIAVMHDLPLAFTHADRVAVMDGGRIVESGTPSDLAASGCIEDIFGVSLVRSEDGIYRYKYTEG